MHFADVERQQLADLHGSRSRKAANKQHTPSSQPKNPLRRTHAAAVSDLVPDTGQFLTSRSVTSNIIAGPPPPVEFRECSGGEFPERRQCVATSPESGGRMTVQQIIAVIALLIICSCARTRVLAMGSQRGRRDPCSMRVATTPVAGSAHTRGRPLTPTASTSNSLPIRSS